MSDLTQEERKHIYGSKMHFKTKRSWATGKFKQCKSRLVMLGNQMKAGDDYADSFSLVPRATVGRVVISQAVADNKHVHAIDTAQAFIQGDWKYLPEGQDHPVFI